MPLKAHPSGPAGSANSLSHQGQDRSERISPGPLGSAAEKRYFRPFVSTTGLPLARHGTG
jgi:hypothetical protein